jgi:hypothetical protein
MQVAVTGLLGDGGGASPLRTKSGERLWLMPRMATDDGVGEEKGAGGLAQRAVAPVGKYGYADENDLFGENDLFRENYLAWAGRGRGRGRGLRSHCLAVATIRAHSLSEPIALAVLWPRAHAPASDLPSFTRPSPFSFSLAPARLLRVHPDVLPPPRYPDQ